MRVLVVNAGSSSLKVSLVGPDDKVLAEEDFEVSGGKVEDSKLDAAIREMDGIEAVGHRVVHGGPRYPKSVRIDSDVITYLVTITDLAPLHLPASLAGIAAVRLLLPRTPAVACFDTAFRAPDQVCSPHVGMGRTLPHRDPTGCHYFGLFHHLPGHQWPSLRSLRFVLPSIQVPLHLGS